jgi:ElaB/YqjD/DUF883 family membrane-anchored ribosome-binding protein
MNTKSNAVDAIDTAVPARSNVSREFRQFLSDVDDLVKDMASMTADDLAEARDRLGVRAAAARESLESVGGAVAGRAREGMTRANAYVHDQPWKSIGVGALVGLLFGVVLARR